jgi:hypothetical protein
MDARVDEALQGFRIPVARGRLQRMMELMSMDGNATLHCGVQLIKNGSCTSERRCLSFDADPTVTRGHMDLQSGLKIMEETRIVAVEGLGRPSIFEFQGY